MPEELIEDPVASKRRLLRDLVQARKDAELTQKDVAEELEWSPSKVIRIEQGSVAISITDLRALLALYKITDASSVDEFAARARSSKQSSSWDEYRGFYTRPTLTYFAFESSASIIRQYEAQLMPGLLQTPEYTRALTGPLTGQKEEGAERHIKARALRQEMFKRTSPPQTYFVLDEAVIQRVVGSPEIMLRQLDHLEDMAKLPTVTIQVVPFARGSYPGMSGPFTLLGMGANPDEADAGDTVLYREGRIEETTRDDYEVIAELIDTFWEMERKYATKPDDLHAVLGPVRDTLRSLPEGEPVAS